MTAKYVIEVHDTSFGALTPVSITFVGTKTGCLRKVRAANKSKKYGNFSEFPHSDGSILITTDSPNWSWVYWVVRPL